MAETVKADLVDPSAGSDADSFPRRWRRRYIESYLIWPPAIAAAAGVPEAEVVKELRDRHGIAVGPNFIDSDPPQALLDVRAKQILKPGGGIAVLGQFNAAAHEVAIHMDPTAICANIKTFLSDVKSLV